MVLRAEHHCNIRLHGWAIAVLWSSGDIIYVHLIVVPRSEDGLRRAIGEAHRRYTRRVNFREGWQGHLWQGRFAS